MPYREDKVQEIQQELRDGVKDTLADLEGDDSAPGHDDIAFEIAVSIATMYDRADAEEFLRREFGYVPESYKLLVRR